MRDTNRKVKTCVILYKNGRTNIMCLTKYVWGYNLGWGKKGWGVFIIGG